MAGRPTKRTPEREKRILDALRAGNTRRAATAYAGVCEDTLANWCRRSSDFSEAIKEAEAAAEVRNVAVIHKAADKSWQAAAWWLERRKPHDYARRLEVTGAQGGALRFIIEEAKPPVGDGDG